MASCAYIEDPTEISDLIALQLQPFTLLADLQAEPDPDTASSATPVGRMTFDSAATIALDALLALRDESSTTVQRLLEIAEREISSDQAFHRCHYLLEPRSKGSRVVCEYKADLLAAARHALRDSLFLFRLYTLLYHRDDNYLRISAKALANSHAHAEIVQRVGNECKKRGLTNFKQYCSEISYTTQKKGIRL